MTSTSLLLKGTLPFVAKGRHIDLLFVGRRDDLNCLALSSPNKTNKAFVAAKSNKAFGAAKFIVRAVSAADSYDDIDHCDSVAIVSQGLVSVMRATRNVVIGELHLRDDLVFITKRLGLVGRPKRLIYNVILDEICISVGDLSARVMELRFQVSHLVGDVYLLSNVRPRDKSFFSLPKLVDDLKKLLLIIQNKALAKTKSLSEDTSADLDALILIDPKNPDALDAKIPEEIVALVLDDGDFLNLHELIGNIEKSVAEACELKL